MIKLFISQPMRGLSDEEILTKRKELIDLVKKENSDEVKVIDSFIKEDTPDGVNIPLWYLSRSIRFLSEADVAIFGKGWEDARGCKIEHECAIAYGIPTIEENS